MTRRYALYFAPPPGSELEAFGRRFLGRDHISGQEIEQAAIDGWTKDELKQITKSARHYGFHATLKAPFMLEDGTAIEDLLAAARHFAAERTAFEARPLQVSGLSKWVAFTLSSPSADMTKLAADCVRAFEPFRAPLTEADIARRRQSGLTPRQDEQMLTFGYPFIFEDFRFHMTLAGPLEPEEKAALVEKLRSKTATIESQPLNVDAIALYEQPDRDSPFVLTERFPFQQG